MFIAITYSCIDVYMLGHQHHFIPKIPPIVMSSVINTFIIRCKNLSLRRNKAYRVVLGILAMQTLLIASYRLWRLHGMAGNAYMRR